MPYKTRAELPGSVKDNLPDKAQDIYKEAFNNAWKQFADPSKLKYGGDQESASHRVAWSAVKKKYFKNEKGKWVTKKWSLSGKTVIMSFRRKPNEILAGLTKLKKKPKSASSKSNTLSN